MGQKTLYIVRHAKTEAGAAAQDDHSRRLTPQGIDDAFHMGQYLVRRGIDPDLTLCSTAQRTRQSWAEIAASYAKAPPVEYVEKLYLASANEILNLLASLPETAASAMVIGHNPGLHQLCFKLAVHGEDAVLDRLAVSFPTCVLAEIRFEGLWQDVGRAQGTLMALMTPKLMAN